jgi:hypothetical protein
MFEHVCFSGFKAVPPRINVVEAQQLSAGAPGTFGGIGRLTRT